MLSITRRLTLKLIGAGTSVLGWMGVVNPTTSKGANVSSLQDSPQQDHWKQNYDRIFLGGKFWANPMEDWRIKDGWAECQTKGGDRNIQLLTKQIVKANESFSMSVEMELLENGKVLGGGGFRIGTKSEINEHRSNCFAKTGSNAGIVGEQLLLAGKRKKIDWIADAKSTSLKLEGEPNGDEYKLTLTVTAGDKTATISNSVPKWKVLGNVAIVNNFDRKLRKFQGSRYRFRNWNVSGDAFSEVPENEFGPILWSMYSLSDSRSDEGFVLKISALTGPLGEADNHEVELHFEENGEWKKHSSAKLDTDAWTAIFRIPNWDAKKITKYKLAYQEKLRDGEPLTSTWGGTIKANPEGRPLKLAALTCQNDYAFPYEPVANNVVKLDPDMLYFSGDQLYENHGGYGLIRDPAGPAIINYLRKFYQFGWSFRESLKDRPTICIPDDHDVFQGNIWGEGGEKMNAEGGTSSKGGYREPARMVNVVHRTCTGHHPDVYDSTPCKQTISVYYGDMVYGGVSFAVLGDRQWKSGPTKVETGSGRADHVKDKNVDTSKLDKEGLVLLGERQEKFLAEWVKDWRGHSMKVLLSQTVFAGVATHHGGFDGYLKADLDSGGWPQTARNNAINIIRPGKPLHINGDQHLTTLTQYGVEKQRDSFWSFCTPAIAAGYPRWWRPDDVGMPHDNRPNHGLANTGEFLDGFGNKAYVYAVGNPEVGREKNRYDRAHQKGSGFGFVLIDTEKKTYEIHSYKFDIDPTDGKESNEFPGWPVTIHQQENGGDNKLG